MSNNASKETGGQFKGLPSTVYVNSHLLKATQLANKIIPAESMFSPQWLMTMVVDRGLLDTVEQGIEFLGVIERTKDGRRQKVDQSKLYDLEKHGKVSSDLKRRSLTKKGSKRFLDALLCCWFYANAEFLHFVKKIDRRGLPYLELEMENPSSPKSYSIAFKTPDESYLIRLKGSGPKQRRKKRPTGRTSSQTVAAETVKSDSSQGSKPTRMYEQLQRAVQIQDSSASVNPSSPGLSYPGE